MKSGGPRRRTESSRLALRNRCARREYIYIYIYCIVGAKYHLILGDGGHPGLFIIYVIVTSRFYSVCRRDASLAPINLVKILRSDRALECYKYIITGSTTAAAAAYYSQNIELPVICGSLNPYQVLPARVFRYHARA